jgi:ParB family transcriptional regulator, chromosome partitioning protein
MHKAVSSIALLQQSLAAEGSATPYRVLPLAKLRPNPHQPRRRFVEDREAAFEEPEFLELVASIKAVGKILQPLLLRPADALGNHEIIAGERRYHAALAAGLTEAPALIEEETDPFKLKLYALIENLHRQDLSLWERARFISDLLEQSGLSKQELAARIGIAPAQLSKYLAVLTAPADLATAVQQQTVTDTEAVRFLKDAAPEVREAILAKARESGQAISRRQAQRAVSPRQSPPADPAAQAEASAALSDPRPSPREASTVPLPRLTRPQLHALLRHLGADHVPGDDAAVAPLFLSLVDRLT